MRFVRDVLATWHDPDILDVGCGSGALLSLPLARRGWRVTGIDIHSESIECASAAGVANARFVCGHLAEIHDKYDVVILSEVLEHVPDPRMLLCELRARLKPDGRLILTVPNGRGPFEIDQWLWRHNFLFASTLYRRYETRRRERHAMATMNDNSPHINFFTRRALSGIIRSTGFEISEFRSRTFIAGNYPIILGYLLNILGIPTRLFTKWNADFCDYLPAQLASGWMLVCNLEISRRTNSQPPDPDRSGLYREERAVG